MMRLSAQPIRHRLLITATTAASAVLLRFLGFEYGSQILSHGKAVRQLAPATGSTDTVPANRLELSVFDQPRGLPEIRFQDDQGHEPDARRFPWANGPSECLGHMVRAVPQGDARA